MKLSCYKWLLVILAVILFACSFYGITSINDPHSWYLTFIHQGYATRNRTLSLGQEKKWLIVKTYVPVKTFSTLCSTYRDWIIIVLEENSIKTLNCEDFKTSLLYKRSSKDDTLKYMITLIIQIQPIAVCFVPWTDRKEKHSYCKFNNNSNMSLVYLDQGYSEHNTQLFPMEYHFGCMNSSEEKDSPNPSLYKLCSVEKIVESNVYLADKCNNHLPSIGLGFGHYGIMPFFGTKFIRQHLWMLGWFYESSITNEITKLVINLLIQKMIHLTGGLVRYHLSSTSNTLQSIPEFSLSSTITSDSKGTGAIVKKINAIKCVTQDTISKCTSYIINVLKNDLSLNVSLATLLRWLPQAKYGLVQFDFNDSNRIVSCAPNEVFYNPVKIARNQSTPEVKLETKQFYEELCSGDKVVQPQYKIYFESIPKIMDDVLLIILYNFDTYLTIPFIEVLYSGFFPLIVFCGPVVPDREQYPELFQQRFQNAKFTRTFVKYSSKANAGGDTNYHCASLVINMGYNVKGYLFSADDTLFNIRSITSFDFNRLWFPGHGTIFSVNEPYKTVYTPELKKFQNNRWPLYTRYYYNACRSALSEMSKMAMKNDLFAEDCINNLMAKSGDAYRVFGQSLADFYYVPRKFSQMVVHLLEVFLKHDVFVEIAVPTVIKCVDAKTHLIFKYNAMYRPVFQDSRPRHYAWFHFGIKNIIRSEVFHPVKWSPLKSTRPIMYQDKDQVLFGKRFLCNYTLPYFYGLKSF